MINISKKIQAKLLDKHDVTEKEVHECFLNREGDSFKDIREEHLTDPPTLWFVAETNRRRKLKICYVHKDDQIMIKTAYPANAIEISLYERLNSRR